MRARGIYIALALLTLCAVFAATAGVREALVTTTKALRQTLSAAPAPSRTVIVSANSGSVSAALNAAQASNGNDVGLTEGQIGEVASQLRGDFDHGTVSLGAASGDWASVTTGMNVLQTTLPAVHGTEVEPDHAARGTRHRGRA
jgi:hypothetical protein